jgi:hypothetical protein
MTAAVPAAEVPRAAAIGRRFPPQAVPIGPSIRPSALSHIHSTGGRALAEVTYQLRRVGTAALAGVAALVIATVVFITGILPQGHAITGLRSELLRVAPPRSGTVETGPTDVPLTSLPPRGEAPSVVAKILEEARATGLELPRGQYEYIPAREGVAARYRMTFPVRATYPKIREFMDRTLLALPAVAIEGLRIERKNVGDDSVDAELKLAAYVRSEP